MVRQGGELDSRSMEAVLQGFDSLHMVTLLFVANIAHIGPHNTITGEFYQAYCYNLIEMHIYISS